MTFNPNADISGSTAKRGVSKGAVAGGGISILSVAALLLYAFTGYNFMPLVPMAQSGQSSEQLIASDSPINEECKTGADANADDACRLAGGQLAIDTYWKKELPGYRGPELYVLSGPMSTPCGTASNDVGPFYCPPNETVYIDPSFFQILRQQFGATSGELAQLYVLAHEYGHHLQNIGGVMDLHPNDRRTGADSVGVRTELQADCFAGSWLGAMTQTKDANGNPYMLAPSREQLADAVNAAATVGDDHMQAQSTGRVSPEAFTHGSSEQRQRWLALGYEHGWEKCEEVWNVAGADL